MLPVLVGSVLVPEVVVVLDGSVPVGDVVVPGEVVLVVEVVSVPEVVPVPVVVDGSVVAVPAVAVGAGAGPTAAPPVVPVEPAGAEDDAGVGSTVGSDWVWVRPGSVVFAVVGSTGVGEGVVEVVEVVAPVLVLPGVVEVLATGVPPWAAMCLAAAEMAPACLAEGSFRVVAGRGLTEVRASAEGVATGAEDAAVGGGATAGPDVAGAWAAAVAVWW